MCSVLNKMDEDMLNNYHEVVLEVFTEIPPPTEREQDHRSYSGASERLRKKVSEKALEKIKEVFAFAA